VAERLGVHTETVANWERGHGRPLARHHGAIIRFLGFDPAPPAQTLSERLRATRLRLGLTQEAMGRKLGLDEWSINAWESGRRQPSRWMDARLASLLDAIDRGSGTPPVSSELRFFDLTRWRRRALPDLLEIQPSTLGERIRHARITRGISQVKAARRFGVTHATLYRWESDAAPVPKARMRAVRRFLAGKSSRRRRKD
jgi:transcriptional regulator with XRE-family HTH domain